jgi:type III secretion protein U
VSDTEEKTEAPTWHKLREARKRGEIAYSKDLTGAAGFAAAFFVLWLGRGWIAEHLQRMFGAALKVASSQNVAVDMQIAVVEILLELVWICTPILIASIVAAMTMALIQTGGVFSTEQITIKFERMSPGEAIKRLFSSRQAIEFLKMLLKLVLMVCIIFFVLKTHLAPSIQNIHNGYQNMSQVASHGLGILFAIAALSFFILGLIDYSHQFMEYIKKNRMSKTELKREQREMDGDPQLKWELRQIRKEYMVAPKLSPTEANVIITNPTHFAVALFYEEGIVGLPVVVAKGQDSEALQIRHDARLRGIPVMENPPLARSLFRSVALGDAIGNEHIEAVAEIFRWLKSLKGQATHA